MRVTNKFNLPDPIVQAVQKNYKPTPNRYGVTSLLKGSTQTVLERRFNDDITVDASENIWAVFGTAVHKILEQAESENMLKEYRIEVPAGDDVSTISGVVDLYDLNTDTVIDYKTGSVWKVITNDWEDYRKQIALYAWMLNQKGYPCKRGQIVLFMKDHSKAKAKRERDYPELPVYVKNFVFTSEELQQAHREALERILEIRCLMDTPTDLLPPCDPESRWYTGTKYAVMDGNKKKALRVLDSAEEAEEWMKEHSKGTRVDVRPGEDKRCQDYCNVADFCPFWRAVHDQADR